MSTVIKSQDGSKTITLISENCVGCGACVAACTNEVLEIADDKCRVIDIEKCSQCGACEEACGFEAIKIGNK